MNQRIVFSGEDGRVVVIIPAPNAKLPGESDGAFLLRLAAKRVPTGKPHRVVEASAFPMITRAGRSAALFRNAWEDDGKSITVNMAKARELHRTVIRRVRDRALVDTDREWMIAASTGDASKQKDVEARKQALRDLPGTFDLSRFKTAQELASAWPSILNPASD